MLKKFIIIITFLATASLLPAVVLADAYGIDATQQAVGSSLLPTTIAGASTIPEIIGNIVAVGLGLVGIAFFILALWAGITWMKAMGNTEEVTKAKDILEAAVIGLVLVLAAYAISNFVFSNLGGKGTTVNPGDKNAVCDGSDKSIGQKCGDNSICTADGKCISMCEADSAVCGKRADCKLDANHITEGLCPGGADNVCCIPN